MGLLKLGRPLSWDDASKHREYVREHGVMQLIHTLHRVRDYQNDVLLWGDEIECVAPLLRPPPRDCAICAGATLLP